MREEWRRLHNYENGECSRLHNDENGEWRRLQNGELHSLYHSSNIVRVIKSRRLGWVEHVDWKEEGRSAFKILTNKPMGKRPPGRPKCRWEILKEIGVNTKNWLDLAQEGDYWRALVNVTSCYEVSYALVVLIMPMRSIIIISRKKFCIRTGNQTLYL